MKRQLNATTTARRVLAAVVAMFMGVLVVGTATPARADDPVPTFTSTWNTTSTSTGSSSANQIALPLQSNGTYDFTVDWGDGTSPDSIDSWDDPAATHTFTTPGPQTVTITGTIEGFRFDNAGDRRKITDVTSWGPLKLGNDGSYFFGADNLNITATDAPDLSGTTNMSSAFRNATSLTAATDAGLQVWDVQTVRDMRSMFQGATGFNADISGWDVGNVTSMRSMFAGAVAFNADLATWDVGNVANMRSMFDGAVAFDRDLGDWDVSNVDDMTDMFAGGVDVGLSLDNYDSLLQGWAALAVQPALDFDAGHSYYNPTTSGSARDTLTNNYEWVITDAGPAAVPSTPAAPQAVAGSETATVTWVKPNDNHSEITSYTVTSTPGNFTCTATAPALSCAVNGLTNSVSYTFKVTATNAVGTSAASASSNSVTPITAQPAAPAKPFAEALNESARIYVSPGVGGGVPVSYLVTGAPGGATCSVVVPATSCVISGLSNSTEYTFSATATNTYGTSGSSVASNAITPSQPFTMRWDTTKTTNGSSSNTQINLPLVSDGTYNFNVSWGDGTGGLVTSANDPDRLHTYASGGEKTVTITGTLRGWNFANGTCNVWGTDQQTDRNKLIEISNWGSVRLDSPAKQSDYFCWAQNLLVTATDSPNLASTTSLKGAFYGAQKLNSSFASWDTSNVTDMSEMFYNASLFNGSVAGWNTANVTDMSEMFTNASAFNQPVGSWTTSAVTKMNGMFQSASEFNQSLSGWNTSNVTDMNRMFNGASKFNGDVSTWNTGAVTNMSYMFQSNALFNSDISAWNTSNVTTMVQMFNAATVFNANISGWNTAKVTSFQSTFQNARAFNRDLSAWDTSSVISIANMFYGASAMNSPLDGWGSKTASITNMSGAFANATAFNQPLNSWNVDNVLYFNSMFQNATSFDQDLNSWRPSRATTMASMFMGATVFDGDITAWTVGSVESFASFAEDARLFNQDIGEWNTTSVTTMAKMFKGANAFNQDLRAWDMGGVTTAAEMLSSTALSTANYNKMLYSWAYGQSTDGVENGAGTGVVTDNVVFSAGAAKYSVGQPADARAILVARGWSITDGGQTAQNVPNAPTGVSADRTGGTATVSWTTPPTANPGVSSYRVRAFITTVGTMALTPTELGCTVNGANATSCDVTGLADGVSYLFDVVAINSLGASDPSQMQQPATPAAPIAQSRFESAKVGWIAQPTVGGDPTSYTVTASPGGANCVITLPTNTCTIVGLSNSQSYTFTATATNVLGTSAASDASAAITPGSAFVSTWRTQNTGVSATNQIKLPLVSTGTYNFNVSWGDGTSSNITTWNAAAATHTYPARGDYDVTITGTLVGWQFANGGDKTKIVDISRWGPVRLGNGGSYFQGASNLQVSATDPIDLTGTTNLSGAFQSASKFNGAIGNWDVSNVTTMANMFLGASAFNQPLNDWGSKTSNVTDMYRIFFAASAFNQPLNNWNVSSVTTFFQAFYAASSFNSSVTGWAPSSATTMQQMFYGATSFNQPIGWTQTGSVTNMNAMFYAANAFNQSLASLNTANVTDMSQMFYGTANFNGDISTWDTSKVTNMNQMFYDAKKFNNASGINGWNTSNVTTMVQMFSYALLFNQPLGSWNTGKVTNMSAMFQYNPVFNQPITTWDVSKVTNMSRMFEGATAFNQDLNDWNTGNVAGAGMTYMFYSASSFNGKIGNWNVSKITDFTWFLRQASAFNQDVSQWNTALVTNFTDMFRSTRFRGDVSAWNVSKATTMSGMFTSITPDADVAGLRATPWLNKTLIAWSQQPVRTGVPLNFSDTTGGGSYPKYTAGAYSLGSEAAYNNLTRSTSAVPTPGKGWSIQTGGTTPANTPGQPLNMTVDRSGAEDNGADATITWSAPTDGDTVSPITYRAQATTDSNVKCTVAAPTTTCNITGMTVNKFYQFTVTAVNSTGDSEPSDPPLPVQNIGPLTPTLGAPTATPDGFTVPVTNYNGQYQWSGTATQGGSVTVDDATHIATITGVAPNTTSVATITASRFAYTDQSSTVSGTSLMAALNPALSTPVRTPDGFTAKITNYNGTDYAWAATALPGPGTASIVQVGSEHHLVVTGLAPNVPATVTVSTTRSGYAPGSTQVTDSSLRSALTPTFGTTEQTPDGFTAVITNYDDQYDWAATLPNGSPGAAAIITRGSDHLVSVTGLSPDVAATVTVTASRTDSVQGSATVSSTSLKAALVPTFGIPAPTADGFTVTITNTSPDWEWTGTATADGSVAIAGGVVTVTNVQPDTETLATITSTRTGYANGVATISSTSLKAALIPELGEPTRTPNGFTVLIENYDDTLFTWDANVTSADGSATIVQNGSDHVVVVTGLDPADPATVLVTTTRTGYAQGAREVTSSSLNAKLDPTYGPVIRTDGGFKAKITNYDGLFEWDPSTTAGVVGIYQEGDDHYVVVSGLGANTPATATVMTNRIDYTQGSSTVSGTSLLAALTPILGSPTQTADGFTAVITNYDAGYQWNASITSTPVPGGATASITQDGEVFSVTVAGLLPATTVTATVTASKTDTVTGSTPVTATSLLAALNPTFGETVDTADGFTAKITNYSADYDWNASVNAPSPAAAAITTSGSDHYLTVTGLAPNAEVTATVTTSRLGYAGGSGAVTSRSLSDALNPTFGPVTRLSTGFKAQITNYDPLFTWGQSTTAGTASITQDGSDFYIVVSGLSANTSATATVTTTREDYANGDNTITGVSLLAALTPAMGTVTSTPDGFTAVITNYDGAYGWNAAITSDPVPSGAAAAVTEDNGVFSVTVTGLAANTTATVTVTATRTDYTTGSTPVTGTSLLGPLTPTFGPQEQTADGFTAAITNYNPTYAWNPSLPNGSPGVVAITTDGIDHFVTVTGLDPGVEVTATVTTVLSGYADGVATVTASSLQAALSPDIEAPTRTADGFTAEITNYDGTFGWNAAIKDGVPAGAVAAITNSGGDYFVTVTGLNPNVEATAVVTTTKTGFVTGSGESTGTSLLAALTPTFAPTVQTADGFTAEITNYDEDFAWNAAITSTPIPGGATAAITQNAGDHFLTVTGLAADVTVTATATTGRDDYANGSAAVTNSSLKAAVNPAFGSVTRTDGGFTVPITNYSDAFTWPTTIANGSAVVGSDGVLTVTGLADSEQITVTVGSVQTGYVSGSNNVTGEALETELNPQFGTPVSTTGGFTVPITNFDVSYTWTPTATAGTPTIDTSGSPTLVVTGLTTGQSSTVTVATTRMDYLPGTGQVTGNATRAALTPTFGAVTRTADGFTAPITNYDSDFTWGASSTVGSAAVEVSGPNASVVVTGLAAGGQSAVATVTTTRTGYFGGTANVTGRSTLPQLNPTFATPVRGVHTYTAQITNYDPDYEWSVVIKDGTPAGASAALTTSGGDHFVTVSGLADGEDATAVVTTVAPDVTGNGEVTSAALDAPLTPTFGTPTPTDGGFTATITNYNGSYDWTPTATAGTPTIDTSGSPTLVVTGLAVGQSSTVTVTTSQEGYQDGQAQVTGTSLMAALTPAFGTPTPTDGGFTVPITNYDAAYSWEESVSAGSVELNNAGLLTVSGLADGQEVTVTVNTEREGYFNGTNTVNGSSLNTELTPTFGTPVAADGSFSVPITNYSASYEWSLQATAGTPTIDTSGAPTLVVNGLAVGQSSTVTVGTTREFYLPGSAQVSGSSLQAAMNPTFGTVVRTADGFTAPITNYTADFTWNASASVGSAAVVVSGQNAEVVVTGLSSGGQRSTATVTTTRLGYFGGTAQVSGRSTLAALTPTFDPPVRGVGSYTAQITNYDPDYTWSAAIKDGTPAGATAEITTSEGNHFVTVSGLADGAEAIAVVTTTAPVDVTASAEVTSAALETALTPTFGSPTPTDGGFTVPITNYSADFDWDLSATAGSATVDTSGDPTLVVTGLGVGQSSTVTVSTSREGYQGGQASTAGTSLIAALTPAFGTVTRTDGGFTVPITNYDGAFNWDESVTGGSVALSNTGLLTVTGLSDGQQVTVTVDTDRAGYFDGTADVTGSALNTELMPVLGTAVPGNRSFTIPINNYDAAYEWTPTATQGTAAIDTSGSPVVVRVTGLNPVEQSTVTVVTTREGYISGSSSATGESEVGGQLDPIFATAVPTGDGFTAVITNYDDDFTWNASSTLGSADIEEDNGVYSLVVTGVDPQTEVNATVTTTRTHYDQGSANIGATTLKASLAPQLVNPSSLSGGFTVEISGYSSLYTWTASTTAGTVSINEQGLVRVVGLQPGQNATLKVFSNRIGYAQGMTQTVAAPLAAGLVPTFSGVTPTIGGFSAQITNYNGAYSWTATAAPGQVTINGSGLVTVTGLGSGTGSTVTVSTSRSGYESGTGSLTGQAMVQIPPAAPPTAPQLVGVKAFSGGKAKVTWAPSSYGGAPIDEAKATCKAGSSKVSAKGTSKVLTVKKLKKGKKYSCTVKVSNIFGWSGSSKTIKVKAK